jgi:hypothetical protein
MRRRARDTAALTRESPVLEGDPQGVCAADALLEVGAEALTCRVERYHRARANRACAMAPKIGARTKTATATSTPVSIRFP